MSHGPRMAAVAIAAALLPLWSRDDVPARAVAAARDYCEGGSWEAMVHAAGQVDTHAAGTDLEQAAACAAWAAATGAGDEFALRWAWLTAQGVVLLYGGLR